jgi:hypothetical protein
MKAELRIPRRGRWRWALPLVMALLFAFCTIKAPLDFETLCHKHGFIPGTGYSTASSVIATTVGGPLCFPWAPEFVKLWRVIVGRMLFGLLGTVIFWRFVGRMIDNESSAFHLFDGVHRWVLSPVYALVIVFCFANAYDYCHMGWINGAGETWAWLGLFESEFVSLGLNFFIHGAWLAVVALYFSLAMVRLWWRPHTPRV